MQQPDTQVKLTTLQRLRLEILGITPTTKRRNPGWNGELQFYAFKCPTHGIVEDYPHGYRQILRCRKCHRDQNVEY